MSTFLTRIIDRLCSDRAIRVQVAAAIFGDHVYKAIKSYHDEKISNIYQMVYGKRMHKTHFPRLDKWDWRGIPRVHWLLIWYANFNTCYCLYALIKNLGLRYIKDWFLYPLDLHLAPQLNCYLPGKLYISGFPLVDLTLSNVCTMLVLLWRLIQYWHKQEMSVLYFMIFTKRDLHYYNIKYINKRCDENTQTSMGQPEKTAQMSFEDAIVEKFFHGTLAYRVPMIADHSTTREVFRLKPNRTQEANNLLRKIFSIYSLVSSMALSLITAIVAPLIITNLVSTKHYETYYPNCGIEMSWIIRDHDSLDSYSFIGLLTAINWPRLYLLMFDILENTILLLEFGISTFCGTALIMIINFDLLLYWRRMHTNVTWLCDYIISRREVIPTFLAKRKHSLTRMNTKNDGSIYICCLCSGSSSSSSNFRRKSSSSLMMRLLKQQHCNDLVNCKHAQHNQHNQLDILINELQFQIHDFFREIKLADVFMSDVLTLAFHVWFGIFLAYTYVFITAYAHTLVDQTTSEINSGSQSGILPHHLFIILIPMLAVTLISGFLLILHKRCMLTHRYLCAIVAMYQGKISFVSVLDYFKDRRTCYSLFRLKPFLPTTFINIIGWSFSCFFIVQTLFERRRV